jgi:putative PIN family toxin of toxin-antitoxin system
MPNKKQNIIIDTNLWVSFLLTKDYSRLDTLFEKKQITLLFSDALLEEFLEVVQRRKFKKYFDLEDIEKLLFRISKEATFITVKQDVHFCRDAKDNFLLNLAIDGNADFLLTGDKDLLELILVEKTKIITIADFIRNH